VPKIKRALTRELKVSTHNWPPDRQSSFESLPIAFSSFSRCPSLSDGWFRTVAVNRRSRRNYSNKCWVPFIDVVLLLGSVVGLFFSESNVDVSVTAQDALPYPSSNPLDGQLIYTVGRLESFSTVQDSFLNPQSFMALHVHPEMYCWNEVRTEHTREDGDGSKTTYYTYSYYSDWSSTPVKSIFSRAPCFIGTRRAGLLSSTK
jgi:hypothetical protein